MLMRTAQALGPGQLDEGPLRFSTGRLRTGRGRSARPPAAQGAGPKDRLAPRLGVTALPSTQNALRDVMTPGGSQEAGELIAVSR